MRPVDYTIPEDGPVGKMLRTTGRHAWRPAHIHVVAAAPGYKTVTTHAFDAGSKYLDSDAVFGVRKSLIVDMDGNEATFDVVLDRAYRRGASGVSRVVDFATMHATLRHPARAVHASRYAAGGSEPSRPVNWAMSMLPPESVTPTV